MNELTFGAAEKVLGHGVVIGDAFVEHALTDAQRGKPVPKGQRSILDVPFAVENQARAGPFTAYSHIRRG